MRIQDTTLQKGSQILSDYEGILHLIYFTDYPSTQFAFDVSYVHKLYGKWNPKLWWRTKLTGVTLTILNLSGEALTHTQTSCCPRGIKHQIKEELHEKLKKLS